MNWKRFYKPQYLTMLLVLVLVGLAGLVRFWKMEYIPYADDADELAYIFSGQSLWEYGQPISWSSFKYPTTSWQIAPAENHTVNHPFFFTYINPWFDHSPLIPMFMGGLVRLMGYDFPSVPPAVVYRLPMIVIACLNLGLIYLIGQKIFNSWAGLLSVALLAFSPSFIFIQRMVVSENVILFFLLTALYFYLTGRNWGWLALTSILAVLTKLTGIVVVPIIFSALVADKKYKAAIMYVTTVVLSAGLFYFAYGSWIDQQDFFSALKNQSFRLLGWSNPSFVFSQPGFHIRPILDFSYYVILILGMSIFLAKPTKETKLLIATLIWLLITIWATAGEQDTLGWYRVPLFAILGLAAGYTIYVKQYLVATFLIGVTILNNLGLARYPTHPLPDAPVLRFWLLVLVGGLLLQLYFPLAKYKEKLDQGLLVVVMVIYGCQSFYIADQYFDALCKDKTCPTPTVTFSQTVRDIL